MAESIQDLYNKELPTLKPIMTEKLNFVLNSYGVPDKERKINFREFENPTVAALVCYDTLRELSKENKSYFTMSEIVAKLYRNMATALKPTAYVEKQYLRELKETLKNLTFDRLYYSNQFGFYIAEDSKFGGYIFDDSMGSARTKVSSMINAKVEFEMFSLSERGSMPFEFNIPEKEKFDRYPHFKNEFIEAAKSHYQVSELVDVAVDYGFITREEIKPSKPEYDEKVLTFDMGEAACRAITPLEKSKLFD